MSEKAGPLYIKDEPAAQSGDVPVMGDDGLWEAGPASGDPADLAEALGLGKLVASGYNNLPTWIDPAADDWADVIAEDYGWVQFNYATADNIFNLIVGIGAGTVGLGYLQAFATGAAVNVGDGSGSAALQSVNGATSVEVYASAGQTDPVLNLRDHNGDAFFAVAPDGSVGGVTPSPGDVLSWDGSKIVWVTP